MKLDASIGFNTNLKDIPSIAQAAEAIGFDAIWASETQHDPFLPLALMAEHTSRLKFGTAIAIAFARSPMIVAHTAFDLARQSNGRFILGLGTQVKAHIERRFGMTWDAPVSRLREYVQSIRAIWDAWQTGSKLNFRGEHYKLTLMTPFFAPEPLDRLHIPIFIAGVGEPLCKLAGELADGFHVHPYHTRKYLAEKILPAIETGLRKADRARGSIELASMAFSAGTDREIETQRRQISFYASTPSYRPVLELHGWGSIADQLGALAARGKWEEMPKLISDEMLKEFVIVGSPEELSGQLHTKYSGLLDRVGLYRSFVPGVEADRWRKLIGEMKAGDYVV
jgi:probable F420-dependent oxidoreductase